VQRNPEGRENQRELAQRALALGWSPQRVRVIDADLGLSGQSTEGREGFRELTSVVSLGHAGIVLAYEASRLARNNADWYALLDLCTLRGTLIADADGIYEPSTWYLLQEPIRSRTHRDRGHRPDPSTLRPSLSVAVGE